MEANTLRDKLAKIHKKLEQAQEKGEGFFLSAEEVAMICVFFEFFLYD